MSDADADDEHETHGDAEPGPDVAPKSAKAWLKLITDAEKVFEDYQDKADNVDKLYASLEKLASIGRDRQFQLFWANIQVLGPSIYSRPPIPVVVPRFKDRKPLSRITSELLERSTIVMFDLEDIDGVMRLVRDDLSVLARGAVWIRYDASSKDNDYQERVCIEHVDRKDYLHDPARVWKDVDWVGKRSWLTRPEMRKRFKKHSADAYKDAAYEVRKEETGEDDGKLKAGVWELWSKSQNKVVWVTEGCEKLLDEDKPHLTLEGFFPSPRPAYATVQRRSLVPVPDMMFYKDQLEEINDLTARIAALADAVKVRGFYPAGAGEIGDAIEAALKSTSDNQVLVGISNWAMLGTGGVKDMIVWLPLEMITATIGQLVELRKQLIDDVYQIMGLSDIMRGSTKATETLGAQELKSQYGSVRIKDKAAELVRVARDITRIISEIMAENFQAKTLLDMSQLDIQTAAEQAKQIAPLEQQIMQIVAQVEQAKSNPQMMQQAQQNPEQAQQMLAQAKQQAEGLQAQVAKIKEQPTVEAVMKLLREQRVRPFVLDIETDSTIAPDENATKQRATEFITAVGGFMREAMPLVQQMPQAASLTAETLKYVASQFRAGRQLESTIEEFADNMKAMAGQPKPPDPAQVKAQADAQAAQADMQGKMQDRQAQQQEKQQDSQRKEAEAQAAQGREQEKLQADLANKQAEDQRKSMEHGLRIDQMRAEDQRAAQAHDQAMQIGALKLEQTRLEVAKASQPEAVETTEAKPPSESISYKDIPPDAQAQMLAQAGISASPGELAAHAQKAADDALKAKAASKPKATEPA